MIQTTLSVSAIIRRDGHILMIHQGDKHQRHWFIPGGKMDNGELLDEAIRREVKEETGLTALSVDRLAYTAQTDLPSRQRHVIAFVVEINAFTGQLAPNDPDGLIHDIDWVPESEVVERLETVPWHFMRGPLQGYLRGEVKPGTLLQFRRAGHDNYPEIARLSV